MIRKCLVSRCDPVAGVSQTLVRVTFELPSCTWADRIHVSGDFNSWSQSDLKMRQDRDGVWRVTVELAPNQRFEFRYLLDGNWQSDYHADGWTTNAYGSENSIVDTGILPQDVEVVHIEMAQERTASATNGDFRRLVPHVIVPYSSVPDATAPITAAPLSAIVVEERRMPINHDSLVHEEQLVASQIAVTAPAHAIRRAA